MSLLLEALKKAEKAKEEAQRRARGEAPSTSAEIRLETPETEPAEKTVVTRAELPDIRQPLEILSEEITPKQAEPAPPAAEKAPEPQAAARASARKVFEAKFREPNPRLPFYITLGLLSVVGIGVAVYFWYQLRPPPPLVNTNPPPPPAHEIASGPETKPPAPAIAALAAPAATIPGLPQATAAPSTPAPPPSAPAPTATVRRSVPKPAAAPRLTPIRPAAPAPLAPALLQTRQAPQVHPKVESAYAAYLAGDLATARADYQAALRDEPANRDALLGLAAIDVRAARYEAAEAAYLRLLQSDPNDAHAHAGLIALRASRLDPLATESRVKTMLAADPSANVLHFTLGNQLAQQSRWAEAQQEYFKAFAAEPDNADFAFNLAVSLDHLRQSKLALEYYRRAIALAEKRGASFDLGAARGRAEQLAN